MAGGVPFTKTRLSQSLTLIGFHQTGDTGLPTPDPKEFIQTTRGREEETRRADLAGIVSFTRDIAELANSFKTIGAVFGLRVNQRKENRFRRGINSSIEPFSITPGPVTTTVVMNRATLYLQDALAAFTFLPGNIAYQNRPLILIEATTLPGELAFELDLTTLFKSVFNLRQSNPVIYLNCWISDISTNFDLKGADQMVIQNVTMNVARIVNPLTLAISTVSDIASKVGGVIGGAAGQALEDAGRVLASNVSIISKIKI